LHFIRYAYAGNAFLAYARKAFTGLQLYRCHPTKLSPGWSQNSRVLIRTLDGAFNPIPTFYRGLQIPTGIAFLPSKLVSFDSTSFAMPMPETLSSLALEKPSPAYDYVLLTPLFCFVLDFILPKWQSSANCLQPSPPKCN
ncbi:MAG: hypothetical protein WCP66_11720, partial [Methylococcales bacterium]